MNSSSVQLALALVFSHVINHQVGGCLTKSPRNLSRHVTFKHIKAFLVNHKASAELYQPLLKLTFLQD